ncbi:MAG: aldehyde dehydrogenase family protein, partial [Rhodospirillaceae bacterium]|nr:aldehyde dehydrogenase family protein [Rhodospirillaceae bacterium]
MAETLYHWIGGEKIKGDGKSFGDVFNPATGELSARVPLGGAALVDQAVAAAQAAFPGWAATPPLLRARVMFKFKALMEANIEALAKIVTAEHGKVIDDAKGSIQRGLEVAEFACGIPHLLKGEYTEQVARGVDSYSVRQPLGIVAGITPFNFPVMVPMWMFPVAIATGNAFILKPSEKDPSAALMIADLLAEA